MSACPGCGLDLPDSDGPTHAYLGASAACWALFGEVLAREFGDPGYFSIHQLTVDTYAVQHPGQEERRTIQSAGLHLMTLCLVVERDFDPTKGPVMHKQFVGRPEFHRLEPPAHLGDLTVADVHRASNANEHKLAVQRWARSVWAAWSPHHDQIRRWLDESL